MCKTWLKTQSGRPAAASAEKSSDLTKLTKCPNSKFLLNHVSGSRVCECMHACALVFYLTNSTLHRNPTCSNKALCGETEDQTTETSQSKNTASMPEKSVFKAKKTKTKYLMSRGRGSVWDQAWGNLKCQYRHRLTIWEEWDDEIKHVGSTWQKWTASLS